MNWPGWTTDRVIGRGANGTVYEIHRNVYGETEKAALKVISIPRNEEEAYYLENVSYSSEDLNRRFRECVEDLVHEYQLMTQLRTNPNVVFCDDYREVQHDKGIGWDVYIKMELLTPLMRALDRDNPEEQVIKLGKDICNALITCHKKNIVHKDIKPQNIFVSDDGIYKLGDFGIAKVLTDSGMSTEGRGTIAYMSPEVYYKKRDYGFDIDTYSLGLVMYWLLNNYQCAFCDPSRAPTAREEQSAHSRRFDGEKLPPPANGSNWIKQIVLKACAYDSKDRYASAQDMLNALQDSGTVSPPPPPPNLDIHTDVSFSHANHPAGKIIAVSVDGKNVSVSIPVNITDGQTILVEGQGKCSSATGAHGDLYVTVHIAPPPPPPPPTWKYIVAVLSAVLIVAGILWFSRSKPEPPGPLAPTNPTTATTPEPTNPSTTATTPKPTNPPITATTPPAKQEGRFPNVGIGDTVYFGSYEQDNNTGNGKEDIEWVVLDKQNGNALLMSKYALDCIPYHSSSSKVTWENCSLRKWLNSDFFNDAFSSDEQKDILTAYVSADKNPDFPEVNPGSSTQDKIYILSVNEALYYFPDYQDRACTATKYTQAKGVVKCWWWLRTPGESRDTAASINSNGSWDETGSDVAGTKGSVRPVLWVKTD